MPDWVQIHVATNQHEAIEDRLLEFGAVSVTLSDAADVPVLEPAPGEIRLWPEMIVTGLFPHETDPQPLCQQLVEQGLCEAGHVRHELLVDRAWEREWLVDFGPMRFGRRLWVSPHEAAPIWPEDAVVLRMDPGLAFGTGTHPTTRLCLQWLDAQDLSGLSVIDYGCGSGVLAVAAALLGARQVVAYDIDPQALTATRANARANGVEHLIEILPCEQPPQQPADVVMANILAATLIDLKPQVCQLVAPGGRLLLSGILAEQQGDVCKAYADQFLLTPENSDAWIRLDGRRFASDA